MRAESTESTWPDETPEEVVERVRLQHGDEAALVVAKAMGFETKRRNRVRDRVGEKERKRAAIPQRKPTRTREDCAQEWMGSFTRSNEANKGRPGYNRSGLPNSGAPRSRRTP